MKNNYEDSGNYIFTLRGDAGWRPMREGSSGDNTGFHCYVDKVVKIEHLPE